MTPKQYKKAREDLGLSQRKAAKVLGRTRQTIKNRETGVVPILAEAEFAMLYLKSKADYLSADKAEKRGG